MAFQEFTDYHGPTGLQVATGEKIVPLNSAEGVSAIAQSTMLTALGASKDADQFQLEVAKSLKAAHSADLKAV